MICAEVLGRSGDVTVTGLPPARSDGAICVWVLERPGDPMLGVVLIASVMLLWAEYSQTLVKGFDY